MSCVVQYERLFYQYAHTLTLYLSALALGLSTPAPHNTARARVDLLDTLSPITGGRSDDGASAVIGEGVKQVDSFAVTIELGSWASSIKHKNPNIIIINIR